MYMNFQLLGFADLRQRGVEGMNATEVALTTENGQVVLNREEILRRDRRLWVVKRIQDIVISVLALAVMLPFLVIVALVIVIDSPGAGPIYSQIRVGRDGKKFRFYKFRSMQPKAEDHLPELLPQNEMEGPVFKIKNDPRITRVGRFLRKTSIDELPQLWNVIRGEMTLVGPRPGLPREVEQYTPYERQRLIVTPGLTCYWQIQPHRNELSFAKWVELDLQYIQDRSLHTDWKIILKTFGAVLGMNGQ